MQRLRNGSERPDSLPARKQRRIALLAAPGTQILDLVGPFQVFVRAAEIVARTQRYRPSVYCVEVVTTDGGPVLTNCGLRVEGHRTFREVEGGIDTLLVVGGEAAERENVDAALVRWLQSLAPHVRRIGSVCTGAFLLARAGLLANRRATTHWKYCDQLAKRYPTIKVDPDPIFVRDGNIYTSAGVTAGMDMALELVEQDLGSTVALQVARELVLFLRRPGGQSQFSAALSLQTCAHEPFRELAVWVLDHLRDDLSVMALAERVAMSPRNFARAFRKDMQMTPAKFVEALRIDAARRSLEETQGSLASVADTCGFRNADAMRTTFARVLKVTPGEYRWRFHARH